MATLLASAAIAVFLAAAVTDAARRLIPNALVLALLVVALVRIGLALAAGVALVEPVGDVVVALAVLAAGAMAFHFGVLGGGDVKLLAAGALWVGALATGPFLVATVFAGGVLGLGYLAWFLVARSNAGQRPSLPYGLAIAVGGVLTTLGAI